MDDAELAPLRNRQWPAHSHRFASSYLRRLGWSMLGQGDWAYVYRSPSGRLAARVSPFEPGYGYFVDLCVRCAGNQHVPRIDLASKLEGGGHLAVLEFLDSPDQAAVTTFLRQWEHPEEGDDDLRALRHEVDLVDRWGRQNVPDWYGIDIGERHVLRSSDGHLKVLDLFGAGWGFLDELVGDPLAFAHSMPADQWRYILDMPDLQLEDHPADYLSRIRSAMAIALSAVGGQ